MTAKSQKLGKAGEEIACDYLKKLGYGIIDRNYYCIWGELDIIAIKEDVLYFIEVKTRSTSRWGRGFEAVTPGKIKSMKRSIYQYMRDESKFQYIRNNMRISFIEVEMGKDMPSIEYLILEN